MNIRILATASREGEIEIVKKCRGRNGTLNGFMDCLVQSGYTGERCHIAHCKNPELANSLAEEILSEYPLAEITIYETRGLCSYYAEKGGILLSCECTMPYE